MPPKPSKGEPQVIITNQNFATKAIAASTTVVFNNDEVTSEGVVEYAFVATGAGNTLANISRMRVKADGVPIVDTTPDFLRAYIERCSEANFAPPAAATRWTIPLYNLEGLSPLQKYASQFPKGRKITIEIVFGAGAGAGTLLCMWRQTDIPQAFYPLITSTPLNIAASQTNQQKTFGRQGLVRAYGINSTGLNRLRLLVGGVQVCNVDGTTILEQQQMENPVSITNPIVNTIEPEIPAQAGETFAELDTAAGWGGVGNEILTVGFMPVVQAA